MESRFEPWLNLSHCVLGKDTINTLVIILLFLSPSKNTILQNVRLGGKPVMD